MYYIATIEKLLSTASEIGRSLRKLVADRPATTNEL